jgi:hypothetical protein
MTARFEGFLFPKFPPHQISDAKSKKSLDKIP